MPNELDPAETYRIIQRALEQSGNAPTPSLSLELDALFTQHQPMILSLCKRLAADPQRAEELAQEAQLVAYAKLGEFEEGRRFSTWVYGIARNLCLNARRKQSDYLAEDGILEGLDEARPVLSNLMRQEREALVREAAQAVLDPVEQEAVHLRYVEGLSQEQITEILALHTATGARGLLQRCRRRLQSEIERRLAEMGHGRSFLDSKS